MSHKVHPTIFKIRETKDWLSRGFYGKNRVAYLKEDFEIREFLKEKLKSASLEVVEIERQGTSLKIIIKTSRPALVIGRSGKAIEEIKDYIEKKILRIELTGDKKQNRRDVKIEVLEIKNPWISAGLISQWMAGQLEKMMPFRRALKMAISKAMDNKEVKGIKIEVSGRLNGIEIARREWLREGRLPRQTHRAIIDYGFYEAVCSYGVIGVKVWLYKGDKFE